MLGAHDSDHVVDGLVKGVVLVYHGVIEIGKARHLPVGGIQAAFFCRHCSLAVRPLSFLP